MASDEDDMATFHTGYHGWMKTIPQTSDDFTPVRINGLDATVPRNDRRSVWNSAGTWEERDRSEWARERLKHHVLTSFGFEDRTLGLSIQVTSIERCDGDAKVVFSRGKKRCGYELSVKFAWTSSDAVSGHVELQDFDDTNGDEFEVLVTVNGSSEQDLVAKQAVIDKEPELRKLLALWKEELLQQ